MEVAHTLSLLRAKDESGLTILYDNYSGALNGIISRTVNSEKIAEEVLQQTFLKIWDKIEQYDEAKSSLFTWMAKIARNSAIDQVRLKRFKNKGLTDSWEAKHNDSNVITTESSKMDTKNLLNKLDPKHKEVIDCVYLHGYSQSQAALKLNVPLGTIKTRIRTGLQVLRKELSSEKSLFIGSIILFIYLYLYQCL